MKRLCLWCHRSSPPHQRKRKYSGGLKVCDNPAENSQANGTCPLMSGLFVSQKHSTYQSTVCKWHNPLLYIENVVRCNLLKQKSFSLNDDLLSGIHWSTCLQCRALYSFKHWLSFKKHWLQLESTYDGKNGRVCVKRAIREKKRAWESSQVYISFQGMLCSNPRLEVVTITRWSTKWKLKQMHWDMKRQRDYELNCCSMYFADHK